MDKLQQKALEKIIKAQIGDLVSRELEVRFKPLQDAVDIVQKSNDYISEQVKEDRKDLNQLKIDVATIKKGNTVIIENQDNQEEKLVKVVEDATSQIPKHTQEAVEHIFAHKTIFKKIKDKFRKEAK